jgi:hypothetical protein
VLNNPTTGMFLDITSPKGDVDTPLFLNLTGTLGVTGRLVSGLAMRRRGTPSATPFVLQAESMTQGTDTTTQANSASFSGAGNNSSRTTFATVPHLNDPAVNRSVPWFGQRRRPAAPIGCSCANRKTVAGDTITVQLVWGNSTSAILNDVITLPGNTAIQYADLGLVQSRPATTRCTTA